MRQQKLLLLLTVVMAVITASAGAGVIFTDGFEEPTIAEHSGNPAQTSWTFHGYNSHGPWPGWVGGGLKYAYIRNIAGGFNLLNVSGNQYMGIFNNLPDEDTRITATTTAESFDTAIQANTTYSLTLKTASDFPEHLPQHYHVQLIAIGDPNETVLAEAYGPAVDNDFLSQGNQIAIAYRSGDDPAPPLGDRLAVRLRKGNGVYYHDINYDDIRVSSDSMNVSPFDGERVGYGTVDLSWSNMAPNVGDTVWVDVWVGTDPCDMTGETSQQVLDGGANASSAQFTAAPGTTYYWQIISYLGGDSVTDPCESDIYQFTALTDMSVQSVDILPGNMITWTDEGVDLTADVDDDGASTLTYAWSCNLKDGVVISDPAAANPTITITKDPGVGAVPVANGGFEDLLLQSSGWAPLGNGLYDWLGGKKQYGWTSPNWGYYFNSNCGVYNPNWGAYGLNPPPEGENVGFVDSRTSDGMYSAAGGLWQNTDAVLTAGVTYTLSVWIGNPKFNTNFPGYRIQLRTQRGALLAEDDDSIEIAKGTFEQSTITFTCPEGHADIGKKLRIQLFTKANFVSQESDTTRYEVHFDDVQLTNDSCTTVKVSVAVKDEVTPALTDTITIDVYDNACKATVAAGQVVIDAGDINEDCATDDMDLTSVAAAWLDSTALEMPALDDTSGEASGDPNVLAVDAGKDVITWSGQEVVLAPTIVDTDANVPPVALIYAWSADPAAGVEFSATDVETPTVTITKAAGDAATVTITLTVSKEGSAADPVADTMTIDVYDDACKAMIAVGEGTYDPTDIDGDCITNLADLAVIAETWLVEHEILTGPTVKPNP